MEFFTFLLEKWPFVFGLCLACLACYFLGKSAEAREQEEWLRKDRADSKSASNFVESAEAVEETLRHIEGFGKENIVGHFMLVYTQTKGGYTWTTRAVGLLGEDLRERGPEMLKRSFEVLDGENLE